MKFYLTIAIVIATFFSSCAQNQFEGRIYIIEYRDIFFQLKPNGVADYYTITTLGESKLSVHKASWKIIGDTTLVLVVKYAPEFEDTELILRYNKEGDYWVYDFISAFRRIKRVKFKEFELNEF